MPACPRAFSVGSDVGVAHDLAPFRHLGFETLAKFLGCVGDRVTIRSPESSLPEQASRAKAARHSKAQKVTAADGGDPYAIG